MHYVIGSKKGFFGFDNESFYKKCYLKEALTLKVICLGHFKISTKANVFKTYNTLDKRAHCAPSIFNLNQKFHGFSCFLGIDIHETVQNQSRKTSVIRLPKFTTVNMARKWHQRASFSIENLFFEDYSFGSLMTDVFLD